MAERTFPARCPWPRLVAALAIAAPLAAGDYVAHDFEVEGPLEQIVLVDADGDGLRDLAVVRPGRIEVRLLSPGGTFAPAADAAVLPLPGSGVGWDIAPLSSGGPLHVVALIDGREVRAWRFERKSRRFVEGIRLLEDAGGILPRGFHHLRMVRDIDGDGRGDLIVPGPGRFSIHLAGEGGYRTALEVEAEFRVETTLEVEADLSRRVGQSLEIPLFDLRDVNGDGKNDLVSQTNDRFAVFLGEADGGLPESPSYTVDTRALRERLGEFSPDDLDFSNLTEPFARTVQVVSNDVDGDGAEDLILKVGEKVTLYRGGKEGVDCQRPVQVLKASGNIVHAGIEDENGDGRGDLWLVRVEAISIASIFLWLIASGSLEIEAFVYHHDGERFARRPSRHLVIEVRFPSLPDLLEEGKKLYEDFQARRKVPARRADLTGRGAAKDVLVVRGGRLLGYLDKVGAKEGGGILDLIEYRSDQDHYVVDLHNLEELAELALEDLLRAVEGQRADLAVSLGGAPETPGLFVADMNGDGRDDAFLVYERTRGGVQGAVVLGGSPK